PVSPVRAEASHRSEMVSQVLFGEAVEVLEQAQDKWVRIRCLYDQYEGWATLPGYTEIQESIARSQAHITADWDNEINLNGQVMRIPFGCDLRALQNGNAEWGKYSWSFKGNHLDPKYSKPTEKNLRKFTHLHLNTGYLWGGRSVFGIDCSGFVQLVYKSFGIPLMRDASQQATQGEAIGFLQEAKCGDLAFFDNAEGRIVHVGMLLNDHEIIHSSVKVRVDKIDNQGIINSDTGERTHHLRIIKRYL
ncbi:MAG TPA: C40 family peptidase, partial [Cyclobacteriaceae bacterium]|nr:C40 family peptidase [Cyclobacteriaceae bacterium]